VKVDAIIWDYDGTLVNSTPKNIDITRQILQVVAPRLTGENLPLCLVNEEAYHVVNHKSKNWQDLYLNYYGMTEAEMKQAGSLWTEFQMKSPITVELYPGVAETINELQLPHGICSQNSSANISQLLSLNNLLQKFAAVVGYDDIPHHAQKPLPESGVICLQKIFGEIRNKNIFYIGDHEGDVTFARNIEKTIYHDNNKVYAVTVSYSGANTSQWINKPDFEISTPYQLLELIEKR